MQDVFHSCSPRILARQVVFLLKVGHVQHISLVSRFTVLIDGIADFTDSFEVEVLPRKPLPAVFGNTDVSGSSYR